MDYYLLKTSEWYADEFRTRGFLVLNEEEHKQFQELEEKIKPYKDEEMDIYFGTNEYICNTIEEHLKAINVYKITETEAKTIVNNIAKDYGLFTPLDIIENLEDYLDDRQET